MTIYQIGAEKKRHFIADVAFNWNPVWSPDGKYLYFASDRSGGMNFWRVPIDEKTGKVLGEAETVGTPSFYIQHLSFSADGNLMAYVYVVKNKNIYRIGFDEKDETVVGDSEQITSGSKSATIPSVSNDGKSIAFSTFGDKQEDIYVIRENNPVQLTDDLSKDRVPVLSPDGKRIVFFSDRTGKYETWIINSDGSNMRQLTKTKAGDHAQFSIWSPDGKRVLVNISNKFPIIINPDENWEDQTPEEVPNYENPNSYIYATSWSPDGKKLVGHIGSRDKSIKGPFVYSFETKKYQIFKGFGFSPSWLKDNRRAVFTSENKMYLLDTANGKVKELKSVGNNFFDFAVVSSDSRYIYYALQSIEADVWLAKFK